MDCKTAKSLFDFDQPLGTELDSVEAGALHSHLADCHECASLQQAERRFDEVVGRAMLDVPVPPGLRDRLRSKLAKDRDRWFQRRLIRWSAAAAAGILLAWLGWTWWYGRVPEFDANRFAESLNEPGFQAGSAKGVEAWFARQGVDVKAPRAAQIGRPLNYGLVSFLGFEEIQGVRVPVILLISGPQQARVYIVSKDQFDIAPGLFGSGRFSVRVIPPVPGSDFVYVIAYTGGNIDLFLAKPPPST